MDGQQGSASAAAADPRAVEPGWVVGNFGGLGFRVQVQGFGAWDFQMKILGLKSVD